MSLEAEMRAAMKAVSKTLRDNIVQMAPKPEPKTALLTIRCTQKELEAYNSLAARHGTTVSALVRTTLKAMIRGS